HRLRGAHHTHPDRARRDVPGRALADQEPCEGDARAEGPPARARPGGTAGGHGRGPQVAGRHRRAQRADSHLQLPRGPRERPPHRADAVPPARGPGGRSRRDHRRADGGRAGRAAAEGRVVSRPVDPDALIDSRPSVQTALAVGAEALRRAGVESASVDAEWSLDLLPRDARRPLAIDLGTGTGCIACAIASERPDVEVIALDASPRAAMLARENVAALGLSARVAVEVSELFSALGERRADVIVSNPPYLPTSLIASLTPEVRQYDPRGALDGGPDGLRV